LRGTANAAKGKTEFSIPIFSPVEGRGGLTIIGDYLIPVGVADALRAWGFPTVGRIVGPPFIQGTHRN
jgi:hypothetical protein